MGKPVVKEFGARGFLDGSAVYENDAQISGQIEGNVELSDIKHSRSAYNITVGPLYYGPDSTVVTPDIAVPWETPTVSPLVFQAPRDMIIKRLSAFVKTTINIDSNNKIVVTMHKATDPVDGIANAYSYSDKWPVLSLAAEIDGTESTGVYQSGVVSEKISAGNFLRVFLAPSGATKKPQADIVITLTVEEDHAQ